jgi:hypothetical protein
MYSALTERVAAARLAVAGDPRYPGSSTEQAVELHLLTSLLGDAVTLAFAADSVRAPRPPGVTSWTAEGLARSTEREMAIIATIDVR